MRPVAFLGTASAPTFQVPAWLLARSSKSSDSVGRNWIFAVHLRTVAEAAVQVPGSSPPMIWDCALSVVPR